MPFFLLPILIGLAIGAVAAAVLWKRILTWAEDHLSPWLSTHAPELLGYVNEAFVQLDETMVRLRQTAKVAWQRIRELLLKQTAEFLRQHDGEWVLRIKSWLVDSESSGSVYVRETEKRVAYHDLPSEVRREYLRHGLTTHTIDITKIRDSEVMTENA